MMEGLASVGQCCRQVLSYIIRNVLHSVMITSFVVSQVISSSRCFILTQKGGVRVCSMPVLSVSTKVAMHRFMIAMATTVHSHESYLTVA